METLAINNATELRSEMQRLKTIGAEQKLALGERFSSPGAIFGTVRSLLPKSEGSTTGELLHPDIVNLVSRFAIPFTLNKTIFRHSNFLIKALVGLASQKAAGLLTEDSTVSLFSKAKVLLNQFLHKEERPETKIKIHEQI